MAIRRFAPIAALLVTMTLSFPRAANATALTLDNSWVTLNELVTGAGDPTSGWFTGTGTLSQTTGTPFTWNSPTTVRFDLTDYLVVGDSYQVFDFGNFVASFTGGPSWTAICATSSLAVTAACHHTPNPNVAWLDPIFNQGSLLFAPGAHSLTIFDSSMPSDFNTGTVAFRAEPVPEPASLILLGTGLLAAARRGIRRRHGR